MPATWPTTPSGSRRILSHPLGLGRPMQKTWNNQHAGHLRDQAFAYCAFFRLPVPNIPEVPEIDSEALTAIRKREAKRAAEKAEQTKRERAEALVRQQELITKWRAGQYSGCLYDVPVMLRIDGDEVVTKRGARFPITHAKRALAFVRKIREYPESLRSQRTHDPPRPIRP